VSSPDNPACYFSFFGFPLAPQVHAMNLGLEFAKNHHGHLSLGLFISSFSGYSLLQFRINFRHFFQLPNRHFWHHCSVFLASPHAIHEFT
jgi:hypothetical protein